MNRYLSEKKETHRPVTAPVLANCLYFWCVCVCVGYPPEQAVHEALATVREYLDTHHDKVRMCVCVCVIGNFSLPFPPGIIPFTAVVFVFWREQREGCIEKTHARTHTLWHTHTPKLLLPCSWPSLCFNWLLAGLNPTNTNTCTHTFSPEKQRAEKRQNDGIDDWRGGTEEGEGGREIGTNRKLSNQSFACPKRISHPPPSLLRSPPTPLFNLSLPL